MAVVLLDTTVLIDALRGRPVLHRLWRMRGRGDVAATSAVNVEEIVRGLPATERAAVDALLAGLLVIPLDRPAAERAGAWRRDYAGRGITLTQADSLIAAAALSTGGRLATGNPTHFPMPELDVEHWPVGA